MKLSGRSEERFGVQNQAPKIPTKPRDALKTPLGDLGDTISTPQGGQKWVENSSKIARK
jgi:hypothetical protein